MVEKQIYRCYNKSMNENGRNLHEIIKQSGMHHPAKVRNCYEKD